MKELWIRADSGTWESRKQRIIHGIELGLDAVLIEEQDLSRARALGNIRFAGFTQDGSGESEIGVVGKYSEGDGSAPLPPDLTKSHDLKLLDKIQGRLRAGYVEIRTKDHERLAELLGSKADYLIVSTGEWKIIPLENLVAKLAGKTKIIAAASNLDEVRSFMETLERGVDGILLDTDQRSLISEALELVRQKPAPINLVPAQITRIKPLRMGERVCVDTCSLLRLGEGMLVGSQSHGFFLVHSETEQTEYSAARPFRVNAGAVHSYVLLPGDRTKYLCELEAGDEVLIVDHRGNVRTSLVGRAKIERRPLILVEARSGDKTINAILQNAETIKLVDPQGNPVSVTKLKPGDQVLVYLVPKPRHFGIGIEETIIEK